jgi:ubiquinone/menaquinone biosynthesis C-methylase UbiE
MMNQDKFTETPIGLNTMSPGMRGAHNYYEWIASQIRPYLGKNLLDIGGGYGTHLQQFLSWYEGQATSIDLSDDSVQYMKDRFKDHPNFDALCLDFLNSDAALNQLIEQGFDTITCLNVLEHIEDHIRALRAMYAILKQQSGIVFLQVPAHQWLYGSLDYQAGHFRRYSAHMLRDALQEAGFEIIRLYHFNSFGVIPWFVNARILNNPIESEGVGLQIRIFNRLIVPVMRVVEAHVAFPFGQSLMAAARAKEGQPLC